MTKNENKPLFAILAIALMLVPLAPVHAWSYGDPLKASDTKIESFGPRADKLLINLYADEISEWETGLETGQIDVTSSPLDQAHKDKYLAGGYLTDKYLPDQIWSKEVIVLNSFFSLATMLYLFDLNNNNNQWLGNPPNPAYPNPVYPNPMSELSMRKAVAYLSDRPAIVPPGKINTYTPIPRNVNPPAYPGYWVNDNIRPGGTDANLCYLYNPAAANATLDAGGFPVGPDGWRIWTGHGPTPIWLKIVARVDIPSLDHAGTDLYTNLLHAGVHCTISHMPGGAARIQVMSDKNFHIYTGCRSESWNQMATPVALKQWWWSSYWHPGPCPNYAGCHNQTFDDRSYTAIYGFGGVQQFNAWEAQKAYAENVLSVPLWGEFCDKVASRKYVGGTPEEAAAGYTGQYWEGFVNNTGYDVDSPQSFMNMHPEGYEFGNGDMTIRYGLPTLDIATFNPIYACTQWENTLIDLIGYSSLCGGGQWEADNTTWNPWVALQYSVSNYSHPVYGTCTKAVFTLRPGVEWSDGTPLTTADVYFTFVEMKKLLASRGMPPPWWISNVEDILSFSILDPYNFEVLLDAGSMFAIDWIGQTRILPKHIWKPICTTGDPTTNVPDPNMINSGAWRVKEYVEGSHILLVANSPGTTVKTNFAESVPITSHNGYYRYGPAQVYAVVPGAGYAHKFNMSASLNHIDIHLFNEAQTPITVNITATLTMTNPAGVNVTVSQNGTVIANLTDYTWTNPFGLSAIPYGRLSINVNVTTLVYGHDNDGNGIGDTDFPCTIKEDIAGSTWYDDSGYASYPYKSELPSPDFKVDVKDVAIASKAFGSYPGHSKWSPVADINGDYKIDVKDIAAIAKKFGWHGY